MIRMNFLCYGREGSSKDILTNVIFFQILPPITSNKEEYVRKCDELHCIANNHEGHRRIKTCGYIDPQKASIELEQLNKNEGGKN